jgi:hypothetical protein
MANSKLDEASWNSLSSEDQSKIKNILKTTGLVENEDVVPAFQGMSAESANFDWNPVKTICTLGCNAAEAAAVAACAGLSGPAAAACILAAHTAADYCRSRC